MIKYDLFGKINNSTVKVYIAPLTITHTVVKIYYVNDNMYVDWFMYGKRTGITPVYTGIFRVLFSPLC